MKQRAVLGMVLGGVFLYLAFRGVDPAEVYEAWGNIRYDYLGLASLVLLAAHVIRAHRWGVLLSSAQRIRFTRLFEITCVGFMLINILPVRLGELARPYLLLRKERVAMGVSLATIVIERILDVFALLFLLALVSAFFPLPKWVLVSAWSSFGLAVAIMGGLLLLRWRGSIQEKVLGHLSKDRQSRLRRLLEKLFSSFSAGLVSSFEPNNLGIAALWSLAVWSLSSLALHLVLLSMDVRLPFYAAVTVQVILCLGLALPSAPAFIGSVQFFIVTALSIFDVPRDIALSCAVLFHGLVLAVIVGMGLCYLPTVPAAMRRPAENNGIGAMSLEEVSGRVDLNRR